MYNEATKRRFIAEQISEKSTKSCETIFESIAKFEEKWGADFCTRSVEELEPALDEIFGLRYRTRLSRLTVLRGYARWCCDTHAVDGVTDNIFKIDKLGIGKIESMTVKDPSYLQQCLDEVFEQESEETVDNIYRCYYWLAYAGMKEKDIVEVKCSDVDLDSLRVSYNGESYLIYPEGLAAFKNAATLSSFFYKNSKYTEAKKKISRFRAEGDQLIRGIRQAPSSLGLRAELSRRSNKALAEGKTQTKLSYNRVFLSGLFFRMYERECNGFPVDFSQAADEYMAASNERRKAVSYNLDSGRNTIDAKKRQIEKDYLLDYERWKVAWSHY